MSIKNLNPYLNYKGTASQAIELYQRALGAKADPIMRFGDGAGAGNPVPPEHKDRVMHARLTIGPTFIMLSDTMPGSTVPAGGNSHVCLDFDDAADMEQKFQALAAGGTVTMPLQDTFWGARFGMLTDAYGINWMFNCETRSGG